MFHPPLNGTKLNGTYRLPLGYQMDASYYYLKLHWSIPCGPNSVIAFLGAPWLKPWYWWSWHVLPGLQWHQQRRQTIGYGADMPYTFQSIFYLGIITMTQMIRPGSISKHFYHRTEKRIISFQIVLKLIATFSIFLAYIIPFFLIPHTIHPIMGWSLYLPGVLALSCVIVRRSRAADQVEDLVHVLFRLQNDLNQEIRLTNDNIKGVITDMFLAGKDTSSVTLVWMMTELMKIPLAMRKAQEEVRGVVKEKGIQVKESHLPTLAYLKMIVNEVLRLHPPVPLLIPRETTERCSIGGYEIPAKMRVFINVALIAMDPEYWENLEEFKQRDS